MKIQYIVKLLSICRAQSCHADWSSVANIIESSWSSSKSTLCNMRNSRSFTNRRRRRGRRTSNELPRYGIAMPNKKMLTITNFSNRHWKKNKNAKKILFLHSQMFVHLANLSVIWRHLNKLECAAVVCTASELLLLLPLLLSQKYKKRGFTLIHKPRTSRRVFNIDNMARQIVLAPALSKSYFSSPSFRIHANFIIVWNRTALLRIVCVLTADFF